MVGVIEFRSGRASVLCLSGDSPIDGPRFKSGCKTVHGLADAGWGVSAAIVNRRLSALSSFYRWALKHAIVEADSVYLADKPKRPLRIPVWVARW